MFKLGNPKNVFWEAFLLTVIVFVFGLFIGLAVENSRVQTVSDYYANSEISLIDVLALNNVVSLANQSCADLVVANLEFADKIYLESKILDNYDSANKLSDSIKLVHKRYDLLRTLLWVSASKAQEQCKGKFSIVVYLYQRETADLAEKASQNVWSKVLQDLKQQEGANIVLIPISIDSNLGSLNTMVAKYNIRNYPAVVINDQVVTTLMSVSELEKYLK